MKYSSTILTLCAFTVIALPVFSQTITATPSGSMSDEVDKLKEKVAEKVEELKRTETATAGVVTSINKDQWRIKNTAGEEVAVTIDEALTDFFEVAGTKMTDLIQEDVEVENYVFITGPLIGESITANSVYRDESFIVLSGKIVQVNADNYSIRVLTVDKTEYVLDIETKTKQEILDIKTLAPSKIGFSKLKEGDSVHFVIRADSTDSKKTTYSAVKILVVPNEYFLQ